jgi:DNA-directed RNA polymerase specialized sigma24 family protein
MRRYLGKGQMPSLRQSGHLKSAPAHRLALTPAKEFVVMTEGLPSSSLSSKMWFFLMFLGTALGNARWAPICRQGEDVQQSTVMTLLLPTCQLETRAQNGDRKAWCALVERYGHRVRVALMAEGLRMAEADELAQEAWTLVWSKHQRGELPDLQLPGLVVAQARFLAMDIRRATRRVTATFAPEAGPAVDAQYAAHEELHQVREKLSRRSTQQQRIFRNAVVELKPHADIAAEEGLSLQRVRQIIWEIRQALRSDTRHGKDT